jgi:CubicO group peptidase (beta-lactamase class C family)
VQTDRTMKHAIAVALFLLTSICCSAQELRVAEVDAYLKRLEPFGFSGAVLVMHKGEVVLERGYGLADRERGIPVTPDTLFDIGSIVKTFTATAIQHYVDAGKISFDDTLPKFFDNVPADKQKITLRQLMTHTAGLPLYTGGDYELITREKMIEMAFADPLRFEPGSRWAYCNSCYSLIAAMLEKLSGMPYEQYIHEKLLVPAGMHYTGYVIPNWMGRTVARGYSDNVDDGSPLQKAWYGDGPSWALRGNGGFLASVRELGLWARALNGTKVASAATKARAAEGVIDTGGGTQKMAYGWLLEETPQGRLISHSGGNGLFANNFRRYLDRDVVVVFSTNNARMFTRPTESTVASILFGGTAANMPPAAKVTVPAETLAKYAGRYRLASGAEVELRVDRGQLTLSPGVAALEALGRPANTVDDKAAAAEAKEGFEQIARGEFTLLDAKLVPNVPAAGEHEFWTEWLAEQTKDRGKFVSATPLWSVMSGQDLHTYVRMAFEKSSTMVRWERRAKGVFAHAYPPRAPEPYRFVAQSPTEFTTWNNPPSVAGTMRIEGETLILGTDTKATRVK